MLAFIFDIYLYLIKFKFGDIYIRLECFIMCQYFDIA